MAHIGYALVDENGLELAAFGTTIGQCAGLPDVITLPNGDRVHCPAVGVYSGCMLVERHSVNASESTGFDGTRLSVFIAPVIPPISAAQARLWLLSAGKTNADIVALIGMLPPEQSAPALILWEYATEYHRSYPLWDALAPAIGLTPQGMDDAFRAASQL